MIISVIIPAYNEEGNIELLHQRLNDVAVKLREYSFEFIFVDDCSTDETPVRLKGLYDKDPRVHIIRFARNCGSHAALAAGLKHCEGNCAVVMAADLQDPPELILQLVQVWKQGPKVVWGVRAKREGEPLNTKFFSRLYYSLMNWLTGVKMHPTGADVFLADRTVINAFKEIKEKHTSIFMTLAWLGFEQASVPYVKKARHSGRSKWSLGKKIKLTIDSLLAFSDIPIRYMSVLGFIVAFVGFIYAIYILILSIYGSPVEGWSSLMVAILVIGGIQMMMMGLLGEYLWRTFDESRGRPRYIVDYVLERPQIG